MRNTEIIPFEKGWNFIYERGIKPLQNYLFDDLHAESKEKYINNFNLHSSSSHSNTIVPTSPFFFDNLEKLLSSRNFKAIIDKNSYMELYTMVYNMSSQPSKYNMSKKLYEQYSECFKNNLVTYVIPILDEKSGTNQFLHSFYIQWENVLIFIYWMDKIFCYLDRYYIKVSDDLSVSDKALDIYKNWIFDRYAIELQSELILMVDMDRENRPVDYSIMKSLIELFFVINKGNNKLYELYFENALILNTEKYYSQKNDLLFGKPTFPEYIDTVEKALNTEKRISSSYLNIQSCSKLTSVVKKVLLNDKISDILKLDNNITYLFENNLEKELCKTIQLFSNLEDGGEVVALAFKEHILLRGDQILQKFNNYLNDNIDEQQYSVNVLNERVFLGKNSLNTQIVEDILNLLVYAQNLTENCFNNEFLFKQKLKEAFESFMKPKYGCTSMSTFLSAYCDQLLKSSDKCDNQIIQSQTSKLIDLFAYLPEKDLFAEMYRTQLSKRLLNKSTCLKLEYTIVSKIKLICGSQFTSRLEGMLNDMLQFEEINSDFSERLKQISTNDIPSLCLSGFNVNVLTTNFWPTHKIIQIELPTIMQKCVDLFTEYYTQYKTSHRRLIWIHTLGNVILSFNLPNNKCYDISCSVIQACLLLAFNEYVKVTPNFLSELYKLEISIIRKNLAACLYIGIIKENKDKGSYKDIANDEYEYELNDDFSSDTELVHIPIPIQDLFYNSEKIKINRSLAIEAAIVRITKNNSLISHEKLMSEVMNFLRYFQPDIHDIQSKIDELIEKELIGYAPDLVTIFHFLQHLFHQCVRL